MRAPPYVAKFDSASAMLRALARFLHGKDFPALGTLRPLVPLAPIVNRLPVGLYTWSGAAEGIRPRRLSRVSAERIARWVVAQYPRRRYPAEMVGSSNGAAVHLCAALGVPWLPQTVFIPVRHGGAVDRDDPAAALEWGREYGRRLLEANPELQLHHMHDPVPLLPVRCAGRGHGGGISARRRARRAVPPPRGRPAASWPSPLSDGRSAEAEWGFEPTLLDDLERVATRRGYRLRRIVFDEPEHLSPLVADLYRWWYEQRAVDVARLLVESFIVLEPWWTLRTASVPFWTKFAVEKDAAWLERYLDEAEPYTELGVMLFSHGVDSIGLATIESWRNVLARAPRARFVGVDPDRFPRDFAVFLRYNRELQELPRRAPMPGEPLPPDALDDFLRGREDRYRVRWE